MNFFNEAQQEQLKEIGSYLRQVRQEQSIRLEHIAIKTLIRQPFLEALESGRYEELPEPVFVQGFIRRYGEALGLDGVALSKNFAINFFLLDSGNSINIEKRKSIHIPLAIPYAIVLGVALFTLFYRLNPQKPAESVAKSKNTSRPLTEQAVRTPIASASINSLPTISSAQLTASPVEVSVELKDRSWLRVKADGKTTFEGTLNKGDRKTWKAIKELSILSGNAGAVFVSANNNEQKPLGSIGSIKQVTFTPETASSQ